MSDKDTVYRQAAIDALADYIHNVDKVMGTGHLTADDCKDAAASVFEELPSVQTERKKGKWIPIIKGEHGYSAGDFECSICAQPNHCYHLTNYCPNCGARMVDDDIS